MAQSHDSALGCIPRRHASALCNIARSFFSKKVDELRAMQSYLISIENILIKNSAKCSIAHNREYLCEFETEFENILGCYSGA
jgi:hypothetical protein